jgi:hypothetical protein
MRSLFWTRIQVEDLDKTVRLPLRQWARDEGESVCAGVDAQVWCKLKDDGIALDIDRLVETFAKQAAKKDAPSAAAPSDTRESEDLRRSEGGTTGKKKEVRRIRDPVTRGDTHAVVSVWL